MWLMMLAGRAWTLLSLWSSLSWLEPDSPDLASWQNKMLIVPPIPKRSDLCTDPGLTSCWVSTYLPAGKLVTLNSLCASPIVHVRWWIGKRWCSHSFFQSGQSEGVIEQQPSITINQVWDPCNLYPGGQMLILLGQTPWQLAWLPWKTLKDVADLCEYLCDNIGLASTESVTNYMVRV